MNDDAFGKIIAISHVCKIDYKDDKLLASRKKSFVRFSRIPLNRDKKSRYSCVDTHNRAIATRTWDILSSEINPPAKEYLSYHLKDVRWEEEDDLARCANRNWKDEESCKGFSRLLGYCCGYLPFLG